MACFIASFLSAWLTRKEIAKSQKKFMVGELFVDPLEPEDRGGVYVGFDTSPKEFKDGDVVSLTIKLVRK